MMEGDVKAAVVVFVGFMAILGVAFAYDTYMKNACISNMVSAKYPAMEIALVCRGSK